MEDVIDQLIRMLEGLRKVRDADLKRRLEAEQQLRELGKIETIAMLLCNAMYQTTDDVERLLDKLYHAILNRTEP